MELPSIAESQEYGQNFSSADLSNAGISYRFAAVGQKFRRSRMESVGYPNARVKYIRLTSAKTECANPSYLSGSLPIRNPRSFSGYELLDQFRWSMPMWRKYKYATTATIAIPIQMPVRKVDNCDFPLVVRIANLASRVCSSRWRVGRIRRDFAP